MVFDWLEWSNPVAFWWIFLVSVSVVNIITWFWTYLFLKRRNSLKDIIHHLIVTCSAAYVFGCAFRSFIPRADVQRITLFDTWWASVFVGRSVATIAELGFVIQWAMVIAMSARHTGSVMAARIAKIVVPLIVIAEICSWYAVVTTNYIGNSIEESLWAATYMLIGIALVDLFPRARGAFQYAVGVAIAGSILYVSFMVLVDVPMYLGRWAIDSAAGKEYFGLFSGLHDLNTRWVVTHDIAHWKTEIPWMSLYFSCAVWVSLVLCYVPLLNWNTSLKEPSKYIGETNT